MNTEQKIIVFNELAQTWENTTLEELAMRDEEALKICILNADGTPGEQLTYGEFLKNSLTPVKPSKQKKKTIIEKSPLYEEHLRLKREEQKAVDNKNIVHLSPELESLLSTTCRTLIMFLHLGYYAPAIYLSIVGNSLLPIVFAIIIHAVLSLLVNEFFQKK